MKRRKQKRPVRPYLAYRIQHAIDHVFEQKYEEDEDYRTMVNVERDVTDMEEERNDGLLKKEREK